MTSSASGRGAEQMAETSNKQRYNVSAVVHALEILGLISTHGVILLDEAAEATGVSKSTAYRLLTTLELSGLVERTPPRGFRPGAEALRWANSILSHLDVRILADPHLRRLQAYTGETVNLAILRSSQLVYVRVLESGASLRAAWAGLYVPFHAAALGKAVAAQLEPSRLAQMLEPEPYEAFTKLTATTWSKVSAELELVRARGYATDLEEVSPGVACVAAPIFAGRRVVGALSVSAPRVRMTDALIEDIATRVMADARSISEALPESV